MCHASEVGLEVIAIGKADQAHALGSAALEGRAWGEAHQLAARDADAAPSRPAAGRGPRIPRGGYREPYGAPGARPPRRRGTRATRTRSPPRRRLAAPRPRHRPWPDRAAARTAGHRARPGADACRDAPA